MSRISECERNINEYTEKVEQIRRDLGRLTAIKSLMSACEELTTRGFGYIKDGRNIINSKNRDQDGNYVYVLSGIGFDSKNNKAKNAVNVVYSIAEDYNKTNKIRVEGLEASQTKLEKELEFNIEQLNYWIREKEIAEAIANDETPPARITVNKNKNNNGGGKKTVRATVNVNPPKAINGKINDRINALK